MKQTMIAIAMAVYTIIMNGGMAYGQEYVVIASNQSAYEKGNVVSGDTDFDVKKNGFVKLMDGAGTILDIVGPYQGKVIHEALEDRGVIEQISAFVIGQAQNTASLGVFRSGSEVLSPWVISAKTGDHQCAHTMPNLRQIRLKVAHKSKAYDLNLASLNAQYDMKVPAKTKTMTWPEYVPIEDQMQYQLAEHRFKLHLYEGSQDIGHIFAWLMMRQCTAQARIALLLLQQ